MNVSGKNEIADPFLYRVYFGLVCSDVLHKLGYDATPKAKKILHEFHKRVLGYETIAGRSEEIVSLFIFEVCVFWAVHGIFVKTREEQPADLEWMPLKDVWQYL